MSLGAIPVSYKATDLQPSTFVFFLQIVRGLNEVAEVRGQDTIIPGTAGRTARNRIADRRAIELRGWVFGAGATDALQRASFRDTIQALQTLFSPTAAAGNLVATLEDGTTATISARSLNMVFSGDDPSFRYLSVELESIAPNWS
jgi:hypothetical protein